jgi:NADH-quinone oxidoreductase subunit F
VSGNAVNSLTRLKRMGDKAMNGKSPRLIFGLGTCGVASGGMALKEHALKYLNGNGFKADITSVGCIGLCHAEPLVDVQLPGRPRVTYSEVDIDKLNRIIDEHLIGGVPVKEYALAQISSEISVCVDGTRDPSKRYEEIHSYQELPFFSKQTRVALRNCGIIDPESIEEYVFRGGYRTAHTALNEMSPDEIINEIKTSGLRGRGGAGFPTGLKWQFARSAKGDQKYIICNADEGDPGAYMDRAVLEGDPHTVLEGMIIAGYAIGATEGYIYVRAEYPLAIKRLENAIEQAQAHGFLGDDVLGSGFSFRIRIVEGAGAFVCGEETALIGSIEGRRGEPRSRPPFPAVSGLFGKPTNVNNVETWANVPVILDKGGRWFASIGTKKSKGTKVFSLVGKIKRAGLVEIPMGTPMKDIIYEIGGGPPSGRMLKAVQTGGPSGGCIPAEKLDVEVDYENLKELGSIVGSGGMVVMDEDTCMVDIARYFLGFTSEESCGQCTPCRLGTRRMLDILENITAGNGRAEDLVTLKHLAVQVRDSSLCALGGTAPNPVLTTLNYFMNEYEEHIKGHCGASVCAALFDAPCQNSCPVGTNVPGFIQLIKERRYGEAYELNREENPFPSVCGRVCKHPCESRCQREQLDEALAIRDLKRFCADKVIGGDGGTRPGITHLAPNGRKVAIVGGGPSGLSAAYFLARLGYSPAIYESSEKLGGMLRYGIPRYRLPEEILDREIDDILDLGVSVLNNCSVGKDVSISELLDRYDAIYLAVGAQRDSMLALGGPEHPHVHHGLKILREINNGGKARLGDDVLVLGGGNVAIDVARSLLRLGHRVTVCYRRDKADMPAYREEIEAAEEEGVEFRFLISPEKIVDSKGDVISVRFKRMRMENFTPSGRRKFEPTRKTVVIQTNNVVAAIGQRLDLSFAKELNSEIIDQFAHVMADKHTLATYHERIFAGGDAVLGPASVIEAIAHGKQAARSIDAFLSGTDHYPELKELSRITYSMDEPRDNDRRMSRQRSRELVVGDRIGSFDEVVKCLDDECSIKEAGRCLRCDLGREET